MFALKLSHQDQLRLTGDCGAVQQFAMKLIVSVAQSRRVTELVDIQQAHLVGSYHSGPANLSLLGFLSQQHTQVSVPSTLNASTQDLFQGAATDPSPTMCSTTQVINCYRQLGCEPTLTCAPYHLERTPQFGENIAWAESNAVVYANSVIGARTNMTVQYLDLCAAITGRMPKFGLYLDENRRGQVVYRLDKIPPHWLEEDAFFQLLGFHIGRHCGQKIPVLVGLPTDTHVDRLRSLGAAAASSGQVQMFHAVGLTPEANSLEQALHGQLNTPSFEVIPEDIHQALDLLGGPATQNINTVCLGTPHFSYDEFQTLIELLAGRHIHADKTLIVTTSRHNLEKLGSQAQTLRDQGLILVTDRCCYYQEQLAEICPPVMTNSAKWAYYGPGNLGIETHFGRLSSCVDLATGKTHNEREFWYD
jgi:predicted aconitase